MTVKFEYISTKKPKWHIYHTNNYMGNGILTFKNNETGKQFQYVQETPYDYSSYNDYINFSDKVFDYLNKDKQNMPFNEEEINIISDKIINKRQEIIIWFKENTDTSSPVTLTSGFSEDCQIPERVARNQNLHRLDESEESKIDTFKLEAQHAAMQQIAELNTAKIINTEKEQKNNEERQALIAEASRLTGRVEAFNFISKLTTVGSLITLKNIKESGAYKELPNINTWEEYCKSIGSSRTKVDEDLNNLNTFGEEFLTTVGTFGLGYRELRNLSKQVKTGQLEVKDAEVIIDGETISLSETDALKDALTDLILKNQEEKKQHKAELKAKDKTIQTYADAAELAKEEEKKAKALADKYKDDIAHFFSGRISKVAESDRSDFQDIVNLEKDFEQLNIGLSNLLKKDYSEFNANMFCCLLGKMIIAIDSARIQASSKYNLFNFEAGILSNEEKRELEQGMTPLEFLK